MIYKLLIADCDTESVQFAIRILGQENDIKIVAQASSGEDALGKILVRRPDIVYLGIDLPNVNGFEILKMTYRTYRPAAILIANDSEYATQAFEVSACDYLIKPLEENSVKRSLDRARKHVLMSRHNTMKVECDESNTTSKYLKRLVVKHGGRLLFISLEDVHFIQAENNYSLIMMHTEVFKVAVKISQLETKLNPMIFVRISKSHIVNLIHIKDLEAQTNSEFFVSMNNGAELKWTRFYKKNLTLFFNRED